eukprot:COSAG06_NODE_50654_length_317_cov_0.784404_1_plen_105_part_11
MRSRTASALAAELSPESCDSARATLVPAFDSSPTVVHALFSRERISSVALLHLPNPLSDIVATSVLLRFGTDSAATSDAELSRDTIRENVACLASEALIATHDVS